MQAIEFLQGLGWICIASYCLNNLGLVPTSWIDAAQFNMGIAQTEAASSPSPTTSPSPIASPSPVESPKERANNDQQLSINQ